MNLKFLEPGNPKLRRSSEKVEFPLSEQDLEFISSFKEFILPENLVKNHAVHSSCVGMAATQVGYLKRIILLCSYGNASKAVLMINPELMIPPITNTSSLAISSEIEGCFSVDRKYNVARFDKGGLMVKYRTINGMIMIEYIEGFTLRVFLHELDHLNGILIEDIGSKVHETKL